MSDKAIKGLTERLLCDNRTAQVSSHDKFKKLVENRAPDMYLLPSEETPQSPIGNVKILIWKFEVLFNSQNDDKLSVMSQASARLQIIFPLNSKLN